MNQKQDTNEKTKEIFANPAPLGLLGLAIGCAALISIAFGYSSTPAGLKTAAVWVLLFGSGCQLLAGLMSFVNKNLLGGTMFSTFSFLWMVNAWHLRVSLRCNANPSTRSNSYGFRVVHN